MRALASYCGANDSEFFLSAVVIFPQSDVENVASARLTTECSLRTLAMIE